MRLSGVIWGPADMPSIYIYVSEETMERLTEAAKERGGATAQDLAENAVAEAALDWWRHRPAPARSEESAAELFTGDQANGS